MSSVAYHPNPGGSAEPGPIARRVAAEHRLPALGLLMTGKADGTEPAVQQFLAFARDHRFDLDAFFAVYDPGPRPVACALAVPGAGRTAMLFINPHRRASQEPAMAAAAVAAVAALDPQRVALVQSLTDPAQHAERRVLKAAGLHDLAELVYLQRYVERTARPLDLLDPASGRPLRVTHWSEAVRPKFERAILTSYEQTQDCPGLLGLRETHDIIAGHQSTGRFDPGLWSVFELEEQPVGVLLLAAVPARDAFELVYLGVSPRFRGHGLGGVILRQGINQIAAHGGGRLHLAVDAHNAPAVKLYQRHGFRANAHKVAMIRALQA